MPLGIYCDTPPAVIRVHRISAVVTPRMHPLPHPCKSRAWPCFAVTPARTTVPSQDRVEVHVLHYAAAPALHSGGMSDFKESPLTDDVSYLRNTHPADTTARGRTARGEVGAVVSPHSATSANSVYLSPRYSCCDSPVSVRLSNFHVERV